MNPVVREMATPTRKQRAFSYVRFSNPEQLRGDSLRRQLELSRAYASQHGLELDETMTDLGVSAFRGKNSTEGALAGFIRAIRGGAIQRGSTLLVESLDRLSRQEVEKALAQFLEIINAGVVIVTLADGQRYEEGKLEVTKLVISLMVMSRAHEESGMKSKRLSAAWENKRANIKERKLTAICPGWLKLSADRTAYEPIATRVAIVRRIFAMNSEGKGRRLIAKTLNREGIEPWGVGKKRGFGWQDTYVRKILSMRAVLGEYQPHKLVNGKRAPVGDVVKDYFPPIIEEADFHLAEKSVTTRVGKGGQVGESLNNIFAGIAFCSECGGTITFTNKGGKNGRYLVCSRTMRGLGKCYSARAKYEIIESGFLTFCVDYDFSGNQKNAKRIMEGQLATIEEQRTKTEKALARFLDLVENSETPIPSIVPRMLRVESDLVLLRTKEANLKAEIANAKDVIAGTDFYTLAKNPENRFRLREEIRKRCKRITMELWSCRVAVEFTDGKKVEMYATEAFAFKLERGSDGKLGLGGEGKWYPDGDRSNLPFLRIKIPEPRATPKRPSRRKH